MTTQAHPGGDPDGPRRQPEAAGRTRNTTDLPDTGRRHAGQPVQEQITPANTGLDLLWTGDGLTQELVKMTRARQPHRFLPVSGPSLDSAAERWLAARARHEGAVPTGQLVDDPLVRGFEDRVDALRRMSDVLGGNDVYALSRTELAITVRLLRVGTHSDTHQARLYAVAAELARLAGWAMYDIGQYGAAQRCWLVALRAAHEAGSPALGANVLRCMAEQVTWYGQPADAVSLLHRAQAGARSMLSAIERAVIAADLAVAHSRAGNSRDATAETELAYTLINEVRPEDNPPYMYWARRKDVAFSAGEALLSGGNPDEAIPHFEAALDDLDEFDEEVPRDRIEFLTRLGVAHVRTGDAEKAVALGHEAIAHAMMIESGMTRRDITRLCQEVEQAGHSAEAAGLIDHARGALGLASLSSLTSS
ncbi:XRE family transcriptional regulator [Protofrankia symbiont of Coriaria ruscifolia]|uniref:XRE family transcriptional regulator n=1 Tax=Protofrankia symbiont of Coriaria ruscifolia TaxID=1306542 RepID=UPI0010415681|nr:XRE family transcriptional regulator [Protofrankia symbiont of Coriaria ruscifolia]